MKRCRYSPGLLALGAAIVMCGITADAAASDATTSWNTRADPTCSSIFGRDVREERGTTASAGLNTIGLSDGGTIAYTVDPALPGLVDWHSTEAWDAIILRNPAGSTVFLYGASPPADPTTSDTDLESRTPTHVTFCKGVSFSATDSSKRREFGNPILNCDDPAAGLTLIDPATCADNNAGSLVTVFAPRTGRTEQCTCSTDGGAPITYEPCVPGPDPDASDGIESCYLKCRFNDTTAMWECPEDSQDSAPVLVEFYPQAKTCVTINGKRTCSKCLDNPFTPEDECAP